MVYTTVATNTVDSVVENLFQALFYDKTEVKNLVSLSLLNYVLYSVIIYDSKCKEKLFYNVFNVTFLGAP